MADDSRVVPAVHRPRGGRAILVVELVVVVGAVGAVGLGVLRVPTLTVPLLVLGWASLRMRGRGWRDVGLASPPHGWARTVALALAAGTLHQLFSTVLLIPIVEKTLGTDIDLSLVDQLEGNVPMLVAGIGVAWVLAGLGEEMVYRGYILNRFADLLASRRTGYIVGLLASSLLFSSVHWYQGIVGVIDTFASGLIFGGLYLYARRNLWLPILAHGFFDTLAFVLAFYGAL